MKYIIMISIIFCVAGCQAPPPSAEKLDSLSNEDLCRALGTYNNNATLVLTIHDELKKRPEKINAERCFALERIEHESKPEAFETVSELERNKADIKRVMRDYQYIEDPRNKNINTSYNRPVTSGELRHSINNHMQTTDNFNSISSSVGILERNRADIKRVMRDYQYTEELRNKNINTFYNRPVTLGELRHSVNSHMQITDSFNSISSSVRIKDIFPSRIESHGKIDMSDKNMGELMRSCLQKHLSKPRINTSDNK